MYSGVPEADKPTYDPNIWTNQIAAIELVLDKARLIAKHKPADRRVVIFRGRRGAGKTWLLRRLEEYLTTAEFSALDVRLLDLETSYDLTPLEQMLSQPRPQVLLIDNVNRASEMDLDILEDRLLAPLATRPDTLIVMAEAGPPHFWTSPLFREQSDEPDLKTFARQYIEEQLQKLRERDPEKFVDRPIDVDLVERYGGGFPWSTYILALYLPNRQDALERCVNALLGGVDAELRPHFMALCILKAFNEIYMEQFLPHYAPLANEIWNTVTCRELRRRLLDTNLVRWHSGMSGYVIDESVRLALEACLSESTPDEWQKLHCAAYHLYTDWADRFPHVSNWWQDLRAYHHACLARAKFDPADCPERLGLKEEETDGD